MRSKKWILILVGVLVLLTAVFAVVHFSTREAVPQGAVKVCQNGKERCVSLDKLELMRVTGTIVNGKGETRDVDADGLPLSQLAQGAFSGVTVTADDEYAATVSAEEIDNAFLIRNDDGSAQLIVFGDSNSKRAVRNVARIEFN